MLREISYAVIATAVSLAALELHPSEGAEMQEEPQSAEPKSASIMFLGDLMAHMPQVRRAYDGCRFDFSPTFRYVSPDISHCDLAVANLETTLSETGPFDGYPCFRTPLEFAAAACRAGVGCMVMANNHCLDCGSEGVKRTLRILDSLGIRHTGVYADSVEMRNIRPLRLCANGMSFSLFNYTYGTNGHTARDGITVGRLDTLGMSEDLDAPDSSDFRIAYVHWGDEYMSHPNREQRDLRAYFLRHRIDVIIGSHPHVVQGEEEDGTSLTLYSLGNFVSNQQKRETRGGIMVRVDFTLSEEGKNIRHSVIPIWVRSTDYAVLPCPVADSIAISNAERKQSEEFAAATEKIFKKF